MTSFDTLFMPLMVLLMIIGIPLLILAAISRWIFMIYLRVELMREMIAEQKRTNVLLDHLSTAKNYEQLHGVKIQKPPPRPKNPEAPQGRVLKQGIDVLSKQ